MRPRQCWSSKKWASGTKIATESNLGDLLFF